MSSFAPLDAKTVAAMLRDHANKARLLARDVNEPETASRLMEIATSLEAEALRLETSGAVTPSNVDSDAAPDQTT